MGKPVARSADVGSEGAAMEADDFPAGEGAPLFVPWSRPAPWHSAPLPRWAEDVIDAVKAHASGHELAFAQCHGSTRDEGDGRDLTADDVRLVAGIVQRLGLALMDPNAVRWKAIGLATDGLRRAEEPNEAERVATCVRLVRAAHGRMLEGFEAWQRQCEERGELLHEDAALLAAATTEAERLRYGLANVDHVLGIFPADGLSRPLRAFATALARDGGKASPARILATLTIETGALGCPTRDGGDAAKDLRDETKRIEQANARSEARVNRTEQRAGKAHRSP